MNVPLRERLMIKVNALRPVTLVGEVNPYGTDPRYALYCEPRTSAGGRLRMLLGLRRRTYMALRREDLCSGSWDVRQARVRAKAIEDELRPVVVLLGRKVAKAFGMATREAFTLAACCSDSPTKFVLLPHPSGLCREWNDPSAVTRARALLEFAAPDVPWGEVEGDET